MEIVAGEELRDSNRIKSLIDQLVGEMALLSSTVKSPRPTASERSSIYQTLLEEVAKTRGRGLYYPYIGSGVGRGPYVELEDGSVKLDLVNGIGIHILGHSHPQLIRAAIQGALSDIVTQGNLQPNREYLTLSQKLVALVQGKSRLKHVWITTSGSMANENGLKMIRQKKSPAKLIVAMNDAFAGRTTLMAEISDNPKYREGLPEYHEVLRVPFYDSNNPRSGEETLRSLKEHVAKHGNNIAAFMFEPVQGEGGFKVPTREFFIPLLDFCKEQKIAIWADEVQTFCRTGHFFAFETFDIGNYIDVCTVAKTAQVGATLYTEEYNPKPGLIAGTFAGSTVALSCGIEVLRVLSTEGFMGSKGRIAQIHDEFVSMLHNLKETSCKGLIGEVGGIGLMVAMTPFDGSQEKVTKLCHELFKNGLIAFGCGHGPYRIRFLLPAILTFQDISIAKEIIEKSLLNL